MAFDAERSLTAPPPPTARSTPEQDAAYRAWLQQQPREGPAPAEVALPGPRPRPGGPPAAGASPLAPGDTGPPPGAPAPAGGDATRAFDPAALLTALAAPARSARATPPPSSFDVAGLLTALAGGAPARGAGPPGGDFDARGILTALAGGGAARWNMPVADIRQRIVDEAQRQGVDPALALSVARQESYFNPNAIGDNGQSLGLFQLQDGAARDVGIDPTRRQDPSLNIPGGVSYLKLKLAQAKGDVSQALRLYNGGGDPNYVQHVMQHYPAQQAALVQTRAPQQVVRPSRAS